MIYTLPDLLTDAAARHPEKVALSCRGVTITYGVLADRANRLANTLLDLGVGKGDRVGVYLNKSVESGVAIYGIMTAGAVYVPLDPTSPPSRLAYVVNDCNIDVLVSEDRRASKISDLEELGVKLNAVIGLSDSTLNCRTLAWDDLSVDVARPATTLTELDLCYILYTSGSTGVPKGIMHTHRSALSWAEVTASTYEIGPDDIISNYAPLHFDLSTLDFFGGARACASVVMVPEEHMKLAASFASLVARERLTLLYTVPLALIQLASPGAMDSLDFSSLRRILFGGEPMPIKHLQTLMEKLPDCRFFNVYGPTETNGCTHYEVETPLAQNVESLPIGRPYSNVEVLIVDDEDFPVQTGQVGELLVRAPTVMKGYWGRPDLNEGAFYFRRQFSGLPDIFNRTGDLASWDRYEQLQFHGRRDRQIKSRGYRIELDEVEAVLVSHPDVAEAAVFGVESDDGAVIISAAVIIGEADEVDASALLSFMSASLPPYALPMNIETRSEFPRTTSGKIDRKALAADSMLRREPERE